VFCNKSSAKFTALFLVASLTALAPAHSKGLATPKAHHIAKSEPLGNSDSETISYIAISQAHSIPHTAALVHSGTFSVTIGAFFIADLIHALASQP
jgi:hypothetical protein